METGGNVEIVVPGDPKASYTCITAAERPFSSHCWIRAGAHIYRMTDLDYFQRVEAATVCQHVAEAVGAEMRKPQRVEAVQGFSWTNFKTIKPIR